MIDATAADFAADVGRPKVGAIEIAGNVDAGTALVHARDDWRQRAGSCSRRTTTSCSSGSTPSGRSPPPSWPPSSRTVSSRWRFVDRAAAFGSLAPLGSDVLSLRLPGANVIDFVVGVGWPTDVTPTTLRWMVDGARRPLVRATSMRRYGFRRGCADDRLAGHGRSDADRLLLPGHSALRRGCGPAINVKHVLGALAEASPDAKIVLVIPASCWTIITGGLAVNAFAVTRST